jgi:subtilisin family serine protease
MRSFVHARRALALVFLALFVFSCSTDQPVAPITDGPLFSRRGGDRQDTSDRYLVRFDPENLLRFDGQVAALGGRVEFSHKIGIAIVSGLTPEAATDLAALDGVMDVLQDAVIELDDPMVDAVQAAGDIPESPGDPTTALLYPWQWNMQVIEAEDAWAAGRLGSSDVTLAILDTGIDYLLPDLAGRVDLARSISFVPTDDMLVDMYFPGRHYVTDLHYHGSHVAMTAVSNSVYLAGVTTQTTLMGVKVCGVYPDGNGGLKAGCPRTSVILGVLYAADNGADVINMSLGGYFFKRESKGLVGFINKVFNYANRAGVTIVVSAGNEGADLRRYGDLYKTYCSTPNTMCISATGPTDSEGDAGPWFDVDALAWYSNYGRAAIDVAAPGGNTGGWVWGLCSQTSLVKPFCQGSLWLLGLVGTSQASPHVAGLAALLVEDYGKRPGRIKARIQQSADDLGKKGADPYYGKGRINVAEAVGY